MRRFAVAASLAISTLSSSTAISSPSEPAGLIRCPDWESLVATLAPTSAADGQSKARFQQKAGTVTPSRTNESETKRVSPSFDETVRDLAFSADGAGISGTQTKDPAINSNGPRREASLQEDGSATQAGDDASSTVAEAAKEEATGVRKRTSLAAFFGFGRKSSAAGTEPERARAGTAPAADDAVAPVRAVVRPPAPKWTANGGEFLADVLKRWGEQAGYTVIIQSHDAWKLGVNISIRGEFEAAVDELVHGLGHDGAGPRVRLYPNAVLRLGGAL